MQGQTLPVTVVDFSTSVYKPSCSRRKHPHDGKPPTADGGRSAPPDSGAHYGAARKRCQKIAWLTVRQPLTTPLDLRLAWELFKCGPLKWGHHHWTVGVVSPTRRHPDMRQHKPSVPHLHPQEKGCGRSANELTYLENTEETETDENLRVQDEGFMVDALTLPHQTVSLFLVKFCLSNVRTLHNLLDAVITDGRTPLANSATSRRRQPESRRRPGSGLCNVQSNHCRTIIGVDTRAAPTATACAGAALWAAGGKHMS
ncbi:hypothetical protein EVAR_16891_1 [Eumeta japonica]|uniref:Uncharacterized protein n=1 Tax=Eumeta variegata TaxID=151549 RepID=A0A4C1TVA5_EUMVA|nr:hypothetical protein EVAR_16891_1 [Eumeta japonica]